MYVVLTLVHFYLVSRPIPNTTLVQLSLNILRYPTLHSCSVHPTYIFRYQTQTQKLASAPPFLKPNHYRERKNSPVLCHLATQLLSGSMTAMTPSKCVVVQTWTRSEFCFICMTSSQFGHPFRLKSPGVWMMEQRRHERSPFARGWVGIEAVGCVSAMVRGLEVSAQNRLSVNSGFWNGYVINY